MKTVILFFFLASPLQVFAETPPPPPASPYFCALQNSLVPGLKQTTSETVAPLMVNQGSLFLARVDGSFLKCSRAEGFAAGTFNLQLNGAPLATFASSNGSESNHTVNCFPHSLSEQEEALLSERVVRSLETMIQVKRHEGHSSNMSALDYTTDLRGEITNYLSCTNFFNRAYNAQLQDIYQQLNWVVQQMASDPRASEPGSIDPENIRNSRSNH